MRIAYSEPNCTRRRPGDALHLIGTLEATMLLSSAALGPRGGAQARWRQKPGADFPMRMPCWLTSVAGALGERHAVLVCTAQVRAGAVAEVG